MSKSRDVQDLIAEFVSSKNQLLHEEIISSIKRESFAHLKDQEEAVHQQPPHEIISEEIPNSVIDNGNKIEPIHEEILNEVRDSLANRPLESKESMEETIRDLTRQNALLREELTKMSGIAGGDTLPQKAMSSDDLRMEFLNFTSAHIQQFNHRIKKTEELIEALGQKSQQQPERNTGNAFPIWLQWANMIALLLIASYFLIQFFTKSNTASASNSHHNLPSETAAMATPATKTLVPDAPQKKALPVDKSIETPKQASTPFHTPQTPAPTPFRKSAASTPLSASNVMKAPTVKVPSKEVSALSKIPATATTLPFKRSQTAAQPIAKPTPSKVPVTLPAVNQASPQKGPINKPAVNASKVASVYPKKPSSKEGIVPPVNRFAKTSSAAAIPTYSKDKVPVKRNVEPAAKLPNAIANQNVSKPKTLPAKDFKTGNTSQQPLVSMQQHNTQRASANIPKPAVQNTASIVNAKPVAEKKAVSKEKVYFGED